MPLEVILGLEAVLVRVDQIVSDFQEVHQVLGVLHNHPQVHHHHHLHLQVQGLVLGLVLVHLLVQIVLPQVLVSGLEEHSR